jgi:hypothetical protein
MDPDNEGWLNRLIGHINVGAIGDVARRFVSEAVQTGGIETKGKLALDGLFTGCYETTSGMAHG